jgi:hypothetical protein
MKRLLQLAFILCVVSLSSQAQIVPLNDSCTGTSSACWCENDGCTITVTPTGANWMVLTIADTSNDCQPPTVGCVSSVPACPGGSPGVNGWKFAASGIQNANEVAIVYCANPTITSTVITIHGSTPQAWLRFASGVGAFDGGSGNLTAAPGTTFQPGSGLTPSGTGDWLITGIGTTETLGSQTHVTINDGFTIRGYQGSGSPTMNGGDADLIDSSASLIDPTWTVNSIGNIYAGCAMAAFSPATPPPASTGILPPMMGR